MIKKYRIRDTSYFADVWFVTGTWGEIQPWLKRTFKNDVETRKFVGRHIYVEPMEHYVILPIEKKRPTIWEEAALAHEVLHLTFKVLNNAGIYHSSDSEEAFNYYFQYMFAEMLKKVL